MNLNPRNRKHNYNCVETCIRLHVAFQKDPNLTDQIDRNHSDRLSEYQNKCQAFRDVVMSYPPYTNDKNKYSLNQFEDIEKINNISLPVYKLFTCSNGRMTLTLIRKGNKKITDEKQKVYLLLISNNHVAYIKYINQFIRAFLNVGGDSEICHNCLVKFKCKEYLKDHVTSRLCDYQIQFNTRMVLPPPDSKMKFKDLGKTLEPLFVCYADSESLLLTESNTASDGVSILNQHKMYSFAYVILNGLTGKILSKNILIGNNVSKQIIPKLRSEYNRLYNEVKQN